MSQQSELDRLLQTEWRERLISYPGNSEWIRVHKERKSDKDSVAEILSVVVPNAETSRLLETHVWGHYLGVSRPFVDHSINSETGEIQFEYSPFRNDLGIKPFAMQRTYCELKLPTIEILEDFRLYHNLWLDVKRHTYVRFDKSGDEIDVVRVNVTSVDVKRKELLQYLTVTNSSLALHVWRMYFSQMQLHELGVTEEQSTLRDEDFICNFRTYSQRHTDETRGNSSSQLLVKKFITGLPPDKIGLEIFGQGSQRDYHDYIVGVDTNDQPIYHSSDPRGLANGVGNDEHASSCLTPVFFKREVLQKYYTHPTKYKIKDGKVRCGTLWRLDIDNSHPDFIIVLLGDLGSSLPPKEHSHWKHYNVPPEGRMSNTAIRRNFYAEFAEPEDCALRFQSAFVSLSISWYKAHGFHLFKPLSDADSHHFLTLRRPLTEEPTELDSITISLSKLLVDSINLTKLKKAIPNFQPKDKNDETKRSISVLEEFLQYKRLADGENYIACLRTVQSLRSTSAAHRKGKNYKKVSADIGLDTKSTTQIADDIFTTLTDFLDSLREHFCPDDTT